MTKAAAAMTPVPDWIIDAAVRAALAEDLGRAGDITSAAIIPAAAETEAIMATRGDGVLAGINIAGRVFAAVDPRLAFVPRHQDGDAIKAGSPLARVSGSARAILGAERVALNYVARLSGIATATAALVAAVAGTPARITCTRKTTPGLRAFEKYAVRCGGGVNHRFGLDDAVLIKDNHIAIAGGVGEAIARARAHVGHLVKVEVEIDTLEQLAEALAAGPDAVLLDNMTPARLKEAVALVGGRAITEASGGVRPDTVRAIAETGVDFISSGWITHSAPALDIGLDIAAR